jgi:hypothetical protein
VPSVVAQAATVNAADNAGTIVHERHMDVAAVAGPAHFSQSNDAMLLMIDGQYRHIHYSKIVENGKTLSTPDVTKRESDDNAQLEKGEGFFKQPFDKRYLSDYQYAVVPCSSCAANEVAVQFASALRDAQHGNGTMHIDGTSGRVIDVVYTPFVLPEHASAGTTTETLGEALPGLWTIVRIERSYSGRVLFVGGHGTAVETLDHFHRFSDQSAGVAFFRSSTL